MPRPKPRTRLSEVSAPRVRLNRATVDRLQKALRAPVPVAQVERLLTRGRAILVASPSLRALRARGRPRAEHLRQTILRLKDCFRGYYGGASWGKHVREQEFVHVALAAARLVVPGYTGLRYLMRDPWTRSSKDPGHRRLLLELIAGRSESRHPNPDLDRYPETTLELSEQDRAALDAANRLDRAMDEARDAGATDARVVNGEMRFRLVVGRRVSWLSLDQIRVDSRRES